MKMRGTSGSDRSELAGPGRALLLGRDLQDVQIDVLLDLLFDAVHEGSVHVVVRSVGRGIRSSELEVEPALSLEPLGGRAVVTPALAELEEAFHCGSDGNDEAHD